MENNFDGIMFIRAFKNVSPFYRDKLATKVHYFQTAIAHYRDTISNLEQNNSEIGIKASFVISEGQRLVDALLLIKNKSKIDFVETSNLNNKKKILEFACSFISHNCCEELELIA